MRVTLYKDAEAFAKVAAPFLMRDEAANGLALGIIRSLGRSAESSVMVMTEEGDAPVAVAVQTPPRALVLPKSPQAAVIAMANELHRHVELPGVVGEQQSVDFFSREWCRLSGFTRRTKSDLVLYRIDQLKPPAREARGSLVPASDEYFDVLVKWTDAFAAEIGEAPEDHHAKVRRSIEEKSLFVWVDGEPVSMAGFGGNTENSARVILVYTPPEHRRRGYASSAVAGVTRHLLSNGRAFCTLFTDANNPTSNHIYSELGYRPIGNWRDWRFVDPGEGA